jgi:hypothetical protein
MMKAISAPNTMYSRSMRIPSFCHPKRYFEPVCQVRETRLSICCRADSYISSSEPVDRGCETLDLAMPPDLLASVSSALDPKTMRKVMLC